MAKRQTVSGIFDTLSEAQKVVQLLLSSGFAAETIAFSTQTGPLGIPTEEKQPTAEERNTGRFFYTLFGRSDDVRSDLVGRNDAEASALDEIGTLVTVQVQSALEVDQAVDLLKEGRSITISKL